MPNRIIKESICTSPTIQQLDQSTEVFFYRLMVACDDYGRFDARPPILRARCFPLKLDTISDKDIAHWLARLAEVGLATLYTVSGQPYLQLVTWEKHQQVRAKRSKFPAPDSADEAPAIIGNHLIADDGICPRNPNPIQSESESESIARTRADSEPKQTDSQPRPDQALWAALARAILPNPNAGFTRKARDAWNAAIKELREAGVTPEEIPTLCRNYATRYGKGPPTPHAISAHLPEIRGPLQIAQRFAGKPEQPRSAGEEESLAALRAEFSNAAG